MLRIRQRYLLLFNMPAGSLLGFIFRKSLFGLIAVIAVILLISFIIYKAPVDPVRIQFGQRADTKTIQLMKKKLYLDKSYGEQVYRYLEDLSPIQLVEIDDIRLDEYRFLNLIQIGHKFFIFKIPYLRKSYTTGESVSGLILKAFPSTLTLALSSMIFALMLGLFFGILSAVYYGSWIDHFITGLSTLFYAIPSYISAILFALIFGFYMHSVTGLPVQGSLFALDDYGNEYFDLSHLLLPSLALGLRPVAMISQMTRASLLEIFTKEYVRTATAMGIEYRKILVTQIFPNALNPIITTVSGWMASLLTGAFFVEYVFNYRGLGDLTIHALSQFDIPVILGCCIVTVIVFVLINILADISYAVIDPRIRI